VRANPVELWAKSFVDTLQIGEPAQNLAICAAPPD